MIAQHVIQIWLYENVSKGFSCSADLILFNIFLSLFSDDFSDLKEFFLVFFCENDKENVFRVSSLHNVNLIAKIYEIVLSKKDFYKTISSSWKSKFLGKFL